jgi:hypothetical protein
MLLEHSAVQARRFLCRDSLEQTLRSEKELPPLLRLHVHVNLETEHFVSPLRALTTNCRGTHRACPATWLGSDAEWP